MNLSVLGISHKTAPIEVREKFCLSPMDQELIFERFRSKKNSGGLLILSTCNRIEIYFDAKTVLCADEIMRLLFRVKKQKFTNALRTHFYFHKGDRAVHHIFNVISGLDSLVLGEQQILGQVKMAFKNSEKLGMLNTYLHLLNRMLINSAKLIRSQTDIGFGGTSVSWGAVQCAEERLSGLDGKKALLFGSGVMAELAAKNLHKKPLSRFFIMNRTKERAIALAERFYAEPKSFLDLKSILPTVDFCICAVNAPHYVIDREILEDFSFYRDKKLLFIDISVPRNIDPKVGEHENVELFSVDELGGVLQNGLEKRKKAIVEAKQIIDKKIAEFYLKWLKINYYRMERSSFSFSRVESLL